MYTESLKEQCRKAIRSELEIVSSCKTYQGSHICDVWISDEYHDAFEKAFIEGNVGKKYGLEASFLYDMFGNKKSTYGMSRMKNYERKN